MATLYRRYDPGDTLRDDLEELHIALHQAMVQSTPQPYQMPRRNQMLFERLLQLDFRPQVRLVRQVIEKHRVAAFLIHGPPDHGQRLLAYRLARLKPEWETGQHFTIDAGSNGTGKSSRALWSQVAKKMQLSSSTPAQELANKVGEWLQTQDVLFTFHTVDYIPPDLLSAWIEEFWGPLVSMAKNVQHRTYRSTHLMLYLIDYVGDVCQSNIPFVKSYDQWSSDYMPMLLPPVTPFPKEEIEIWIDGSIELLPADVSVARLLDDPCLGIPELVYEQICQYCGVSWEGEVAQ